ncbi:GntR family transcriptional regulator [Paracoccus rhizosphaerae]|uniref:GntR family transcriptional regulator n=1 Tax=Paracoccus rhizosphaerae TaxID=1133347 RepID=A0ABV6CQ71_9RHOB|nr:GntR family transcriptional regulator [Paracoccus rhizosphaerae]
MTTATLTILPVRHETVQSRVYDGLRQMLMSARFLPGQALRINNLAQPIPRPI